MPIFSIWIMGEVLRGLSTLHGNSKLLGQEAVSNAKAEIIYKILDSNPDYYQQVTDKDVRSRMNIVFRIRDPETEQEFLTGATNRNLLGLAGHRSVGGVRVSNYNAVPVKSIEKLASYMEDFVRRKR